MFLLRRAALPYCKIPPYTVKTVLNVSSIRKISQTPKFFNLNSLPLLKGNCLQRKRLGPLLFGYRQVSLYGCSQVQRLEIFFSNVHSYSQVTLQHSIFSPEGSVRATEQLTKLTSPVSFWHFFKVCNRTVSKIDWFCGNG